MAERETTGSVIVTGIPGAGKSSIAHALAARAPLGAHLDIDVIYELIVGGIEFRADSPDEDFWQLELARKHICMLARSFANESILPVVDDVIPDRSVLDKYLLGLPPPVRLVALAPSIEVVLRRDEDRTKHVAKRWMHLADPMKRSLGSAGLWLDTSELDVSATIQAIEHGWELARLD